jgi:hypothetical protein
MKKIASNRNYKLIKEAKLLSDYELNKKVQSQELQINDLYSTQSMHNDMLSRLWDKIERIEVRITNLP